MAPPVIAEVKGHRPQPSASLRDTDPSSLSAPEGSKGVGIEAFVGDSATAAHGQQRWLDRVKMQCRGVVGKAGPLVSQFRKSAASAQ